MLLDQDGCLHIEKSKKLYHALSREYFYELLKTSSIYFNSEHNQEDPNEIPRIDLINSVSTQLSRHDLTIDSDSYHFYLHCWTIAEGVGDDMWRTSVKNKSRDVVIQTNFERLKLAFDSNAVYGGKVQYRKLNDFEMSRISPLAKKFVKGNHYAKEDEFRLLISRKIEEQKHQEFIKVPVILADIIEGVTIKGSLAKRSRNKMRRLLDENDIKVEFEEYPPPSFYS